MRRNKWLALLVLFSVAVAILTGCVEEEPSWTSFEGAANEKTFPVPKEASKTDRASSNSDMDYVRYALPALKESDSLPAPYLEEIAAWGWTEEPNLSTSNQKVFQKNKHMVHLSVHDGSFTVLVPKDGKTAVKSKSVDLN
ncbi:MULTISPECIES: hypothetical protein [Paenibacillus]|uniref:hypothetical protein n=1 Tax=Paenibacillus TaxID=44249 RepID=UPI00024EFE34|nr:MULTISPECIES: hypothetical protein [Paenibacillus]EHS59972.1 hypothetical protein WG8_0001 [Paenibacillus sp. Aloe-11]MEC0182728.1 hypothetical protein [Paenibacillus peoriae]MEC0238051.1 hypothetical protein [Paenibacillus kribbensis]